MLCLHIIGLTVLGLTDPEAYRRAAWPESGWAEQLTSVWYAGAGLIMFVVAARARGARAPARSIYILGGVMMVFLAGEEASWGQFWFDIPVPDFLAEINYQQELNVHNIRGVQDGLLAEIFRQLQLALCIITVAVLFGGRERLLGVPLPSMPLVLGILAIEPILYYVDLPRLMNMLFHESNVLLTLLAAYAIINGPVRALPAVVSAPAIAVAVAYSMMQIRLAVDWRSINEIREYLYATIYLWYAVELLLAQGRFGILERIPHQGLKLTSATSSCRMGMAVGALVIAASIGLALFVYLGHDSEGRYFENVYFRPFAGQPPAARAAFDIHFRDGRLYYIKEDCAEPDTAAAFFLHLYPAQVADLPAVQQEYGFANLDFDFAERGAVSAGKCAVFIELPQYPIARIHTGQYKTEEGRLWEVEIEPPP